MTEHPIYDESSESHVFYKNLLQWIDVNFTLHGLEHAKLIRDMSQAEYDEYKEFITEHIHKIRNKD